MQQKSMKNRKFVKNSINPWFSCFKLYGSLSRINWKYLLERLCSNFEARTAVNMIVV